MVLNIITALGFIAGIITSSGFIPQIIKGYRIKRLDDVSYLMLFVLTIGMILWLIYGLLKTDPAIISANLFAVICCTILITMKHHYRSKSSE
ncbi:MAG: SemiSWEET family transporter [Candidatus Thermoplasmatota archaeon]